MSNVQRKKRLTRYKGQREMDQRLGIRQDEKICCTKQVYQLGYLIKWGREGLTAPVTAIKANQMQETDR